MTLSLNPRPKPVRPIVAEFLDKITRPRYVQVHTATDEAGDWFLQECKAFGIIASESPFMNMCGDGCFVLIVKLNYDVDEVAAYINAWRPQPNKNELNPAWVECIDHIDFNNPINPTHTEDHHE